MNMPVIGPADGKNRLVGHGFPLSVRPPICHL